MIGLLILVFISTASLCSSNQECFLQAQELYESKEYGKSLETYDAITNKGPATWYNMGNCAYHMNRHDDACIYWLRARNGANQDQLAHIKNNVKMLSDKVGTAIDIGFIESPFNYVPLVGLQIIFFFFWILFFWVSTRRHRRKKEILFLLGIAIIISGYLLIIKYRINKRTYAMVQKDTVAFFAGPDAKYHSVGSLQRYDIVTICKNVDSWCKINHRDRTGWIPTQELVTL